MKYQGKYIDIKYWRDVWKADHDLGEISSSKVLRSHLWVDNWTLMRVSVAYHVFSSKFQQVVKNYNNEEGEYDSILLYMKHVLGIWNVVNTKTPLRKCVVCFSSYVVFVVFYGCLALA